MTPQQLAKLASAFETKPSFEFLSAEGNVGFPANLLELKAKDIQQMIALSEDYAREVQALADGESATSR